MPSVEELESVEDCYRRWPLDLGKRQIRVLELSPGKRFRRSTVSATLRIVSLEDDPNYEALSYTWGASTGRHTILVNNRYRLPISENLHQVLIQFRERSPAPTLWIDALCINQADDLEKGHQVAFMAEIYKRARSVSIWLGTERGPAVPSWHERVWVLQEYAFAQSANFWVGEQSFKRDRLAGLVVRAYAYDKQEMNKLFEILDGIDRLINSRQHHATIFPALRISRYANATDPRDKVYSLLGLIGPNEAKLIAVDYSLPCPTVYAMMTYAWICEERSLSVLSEFVGFGRDRMPELPTWAVDLSGADRHYQMSTGVTRPAGAFVATVNSDFTLLTLRGRVLGTVRSTTTVSAKFYETVKWPGPMANLTHVARRLTGFVDDQSWRKGGHVYSPTELLATTEPNPHPLSTLLCWIFRYRDLLNGDDGASELTFAMSLERYNRDVSTTRSSTRIFLDFVYLDYVYRASGRPKGRQLFDNLCLFITSPGALLGLAPFGTTEGDKLLLCEGCELPLILSPRGKHWAFRGLAYAHGVMNGELMERWKDSRPPEEDFVVC